MGMGHFGQQRSNYPPRGGWNNRGGFGFPPPMGQYNSQFADDYFAGDCSPYGFGGYPDPFFNAPYRHQYNQQRPHGGVRNNRGLEFR